MTTRLLDLVARAPDDMKVPLAEAHIVAAYQAFAEGRAGKKDADLIIQDLAMYSGYFHVTSQGTPEGELKYAEGARSVFARIMFMLNLPVERIYALQQVLNADAGLYQLMQGD